jgi:acetoin utilization protein AcuB
MLGAREPRIRLAVLVPNVPGELAQLTQVIFKIGGNILALGTFLGESSQKREVTFKVARVDRKSLIAAVEPLVERIVDVR